MLDANIHESLNALNASQLAMLLVMRKGLDFGYDYTFTDDDGRSATVDHAFLAAAPGDLLEVIFEENEHDDAINEVRYEAEDVSGIAEWCHYSWGSPSQTKLMFRTEEAARAAKVGHQFLA